MTDLSSLPDRLARAIALAGPIPVAQFMAAANAHYYATRDPLGAAGDFVTAPEISQMFGELAGLWSADLWDRAGRPDIAWVELGPGRGTLAVDAGRAMAKAGLAPPVHLVETSPVLRAAQRQRLPDAHWHDDVATLPDGPLLIVANEFFDALPIRQLVKGAEGWRERLVACQDTLFLPIAGPPVPDEPIPAPLRDAPPGAVLEVSPAAVATMRSLARRLVEHGGATLIVDYGHEGPLTGDTLQAVRAHGFANPYDAPGEHDLSAHVDFTTLAAAAQAEGAVVWGPVEQGEWLVRLGIDARAAALARATPDRAEQIAADRMRLVNADTMGRLFKVLAVTAPGWPTPAGVRMIAYRDARLADGPALDAMARAIWLETFAGSAPDADLQAYVAQAYGPAGKLLRDLADPAARFHVAVEDESILGYAKLVAPFVDPALTDAGALQLSQIYVVADRHGTGIGPCLMDWATATARAAGAPALLLTVWENNVRARRFYERRGFVHVGDYAFETGSQVDRDLVMRLAL